MEKTSSSMKAPGSPRGRSRFDLGGRTWPAAAVWSVGATLYLSADKAGMIRTLTEADLARLCRLDERTVRAALVILRRLRVAKCSRPSRRRPVVWSMNLGGLDSPFQSRNEPEAAARESRLTGDRISGSKQGSWRGLR